MSRRALIGTGISALIGVACGGENDGSPTSTTAISQDTSLANKVIDLRPTDTVVPQAEFITPQSDFFLIDTVGAMYPRVDEKEWSLRIHGMVEQEVTITYDDILAMPQVEHVVTLACVSNEVGDELIGNARWGGVLLADLLKMAGIKPAAEQLVSRSADGWTCGTPVSAVTDGRPAMLATHMNDEVLTGEHGFPVRMIVPGLFGFVSATKWVTEIEATTWDAFSPYWLERGWAREAPIISSSRIDVPRPGQSMMAEGVNVGGFAWAPRAGVKRVDLRVDDGPWKQCEIVEDATGDAWVQWRTRVAVSKGHHTLTVRCTDTQSREQVAEERDVIPAGATGLHSVEFTAI